MSSLLQMNSQFSSATSHRKSTEQVADSESSLQASAETLHTDEGMDKKKKDMDYHVIVLVGLLAFHALFKEFGGRAVFHWGKGNKNFSPASGTKDVVFISGQVGNVDTLQQTNAETQAAEALAKVDEQLKGVGSSKQKILFASISLRDKADADAVNKAWGTWLDGNTAPARCCVEAGVIRPGALVEIVTIAAR